MRVAYNDKDDKARLHGYVQFNKYTITHTPIHPHTHTPKSREAKWRMQWAVNGQPWRRKRNLKGER